MRPLPLVALVAALAACAAAPPRAPAPVGTGPEAAARDALFRFAAAAADARWEEAYPLLSARWRSRTTPARLGLDWKASGPVGPEAAARVLALLDGGARVVVSGRAATLPVGEARAARLVAEDGAWRVDALE